MDPLYPISFTLNGREVKQEVSTRTTLADLLRHGVGLTATHIGCEQGSCGACSLMVDGRMIRSCLVFAIQLDGTNIETVEGFASDPKMDALRQAFAERNALQCGFCTSGMLIAARDLLDREVAPDRDAIREFISGNFCRCTGYEAIVDAISQVVEGQVIENKVVESSSQSQDI